MGVKKYRAKGKEYWRVDEWIVVNGRRKRVRQSKIPTKEQAVAYAAKLKADAFEGRFFDVKKEKPSPTVAELCAMYEPKSRREKKSWQSDVARSRYLCRHLGTRFVTTLTQRDIDEYRELRLAEVTRRGGRPSPASLDLELAQLKRMCSYAVECGITPINPVARVKLLRKPNVRTVTVDEATFAKLVEAADQAYRPILLMAYDTGMRESEILNLRWSQLDLKAGAVRLGAEDTKTSKARTVFLTDRVRKAIAALPRHLGTDYVFVSCRTGSKWSELRRMFNRARKAIGREEMWFHDLRRSFVTNARRRGVQESVVMRMSGHRTRNVFDRYNVVDDSDVQQAVKVIEAGAAKALADASVEAGRVLDTVRGGRSE
jgi:integrase